MSLREASITLKELLPVVLACAIWGRQWADSMVVVHCDNEGAVAAVNAGHSKATDYAPSSLPVLHQGTLQSRPEGSAYPRKMQHLSRCDLQEQPWHVIRTAA